MIKNEGRKIILADAQVLSRLERVAYVDIFGLSRFEAVQNPRTLYGQTFY